MGRCSLQSGAAGRALPTRPIRLMKAALTMEPPETCLSAIHPKSVILSD
ncbi:hypothetical protein CHELA1G11_12767 [Hyphomicrobiales bacterium]|nr:hypothetical protein CHELA1G11_12767 [Hyphomicrobiales bacterium]